MFIPRLTRGLNTCVWPFCLAREQYIVNIKKLVRNFFKLQHTYLYMFLPLKCIIPHFDCNTLVITLRDEEVTRPFWTLLQDVTFILLLYS